MAFNVTAGILAGTGLGLVTVGLATLAPVPFLGAVGACTVWGYYGAGVTATAGTVLGGLLGPKLLGRFARDRRQGLAAEGAGLETEASLISTARVLAETVSELRGRLEGRDAGDADLLHLVRVLVCAGRADGPLTEVEADAVRAVAFGSSTATLPDELSRRVDAALAEDVSLRSASTSLDAIRCAPLRGLVRKAIDVVMWSDAGHGALHAQEVRWLAAWDRFHEDHAA